MIFIIAYISIGVLINYFGPLAKELNKEIIKIKEPSIISIIYDKPPIKSWKINLFILMYRSVFALFFPFLFIIYIIDIIKEKNKKVVNSESIDINFLSFKKIGPGIGDLKCNNCGFAVQLTSSIHGYKNDFSEPWGICGLQCQSCGNFESVEVQLSNKVNMCECGGKLDRDQPLFCPKCKSHELSYQRTITT